MHVLEEVRIKLRISKTEMARRLGILKSSYSNIIHGKHGLSKRVALKAYEEFGIPLEDLLRAEVEERKATGTDGPNMPA